MAKSKLEETLAYQLKLLKIPFEREIECIPGRKYRFDFHLGHGLLVECDGGLHLGFRGGHSSKDGIIRDMEKANLACLHGFRLLRFDSGSIYSGSAVDLIQRVLAKLQSGPTKKN